MKVSHLNPRRHAKVHESSRLRDESVPPETRSQSSRVVSVGKRGARARTNCAEPIHLSVGYNACHWCSVLEKESFEDEGTARILNDHFVNIKVDREERPDIDRIYQIAQQMLTQRGGGWPLTMFLTHDDQRPFFGGTYFPKEARYGLPAFKDILLRVAEYYRDHAADLRSQNDALMVAFAALQPPPAAADTELSDAPLKSCRAQLARSFDSRSGGFGGRPSFRIRRASSGCCATGTRAPPLPSPTCRGCTWPPSRCGAWPRAGSTTSWAGASAATRSMSTG